MKTNCVYLWVIMLQQAVFLRKVQLFWKGTFFFIIKRQIMMWRKKERDDGRHWEKQRPLRGKKEKKKPWDRWNDWVQRGNGYSVVMVTAIIPFLPTESSEGFSVRNKTQWWFLEKRIKVVATRCGTSWRGYMKSHGSDPEDDYFSMTALCFFPLPPLPFTKDYNFALLDWRMTLCGLQLHLIQ